MRKNAGESQRDMEQRQVRQTRRANNQPTSAEGGALRTQDNRGKLDNVEMALRGAVDALSAPPKYKKKKRGAVDRLKAAPGRIGGAITKPFEKDTVDQFLLGARDALTWGIIDPVVNPTLRKMGMDIPEDAVIEPDRGSAGYVAGSIGVPAWGLTSYLAKKGGRAAAGAIQAGLPSAERAMLPAAERKLLGPGPAQGALFDDTAYVVRSPYNPASIGRSGIIEDPLSVLGKGLSTQQRLNQSINNKLDEDYGKINQSPSTLDSPERRSYREFLQRRASGEAHPVPKKAKKGKELSEAERYWNKILEEARKRK